MSVGGPTGEGRVVVVTGATGRQGGAVARRLIAEGWAVRGLTRDAHSDKATRLRTAGVEVVQGDMADPASLAPAFTGAHGVYSVQNPMISGPEMEVVQGQNVADAAAGAGVQHVVYGSAGPGQAGTGVRQWDSKREVEEHMRQLGLPLTVLRPMAFMELMTDKAYYPSVSVWYLMPKLVGWDRPLPWVCVDDLAVIAAEALGKPDKFVGRDLPIAADTRTLAECRSLWSDVMGRSPRRFPMPTRLFERFVGDDTTRMWRWLHDNAVDADLGVAAEIHPGIQTVREWLVQRRAAAKG